MKITIENTQRDKRKISIEEEYDDITFDDLIEDFIRPLLIGYGYAEKTVDKYLNSDKN